jgi:hypothetical protein
MSAPSRVYPTPDPAELAAKIKAAGGPPMDFTQPTGQASDSTPLGEVTLGWIINGPSVTVTILKKPWTVPAGTVWEPLDSLFS